MKHKTSIWILFTLLMCCVAILTVISFRGQNPKGHHAYDPGPYFQERPAGKRVEGAYHYQENGVWKQKDTIIYLNDKP